MWSPLYLFMFRKLFALWTAFALSGVLSFGLALADDVHNNLDVSIDATLEVMNITTGGAGTVTFKVHSTTGGGDTENGCNLDNGEAVSFNVLTSNSGVATTSSTAITFNGPGCGGTQSITVNGIAGGSATISLSSPTSNTT